MSIKRRGVEQARKNSPACSNVPAVGIQLSDQNRSVEIVFAAD